MIFNEYGWWAVEIATENGRGDAYSDWLLVALWKAWRRSTSTGAKRG